MGISCPAASTNSGPGHPPGLSLLSQPHCMTELEPTQDLAGMMEKVVFGPHLRIFPNCCHMHFV
jgi:hypothetical protein